MVMIFDVNYGRYSMYLYLIFNIINRIIALFLKNTQVKNTLFL